MLMRGKIRILISLMIALMVAFPSFASDTSQGIFADAVKTLTVKNPDYFMSSPVIRLGTSDRLWINFDILGDDVEYLRYRLIHCNSDWQPSRLLESEFVDGFNEAEVNDYGFSTNTYIHYVNYNIEIPNEDMPILASGNYLLQVYPEGEPDDVILQARFSVTENSVGVDGVVTSRTDKGFNTEFQQLMLAIDNPPTSGLNPYQDFIVTVTQNNRPETQRTVTHPMRVDGSKIIFEHDMNLVFNAGNEYRRFETVRADYAGMHVDSVIFGGTNWHAWLAEDSSRVPKDYVYDSTQNGRFLIDEYNATEADLGADYITVHFTLDAPEIIGGDVYIDGEFTNHRFSENNRMIFDQNTRKYTKQIPLKQGSYNYQYVVKPKSGGPADSSIIEGNKYETHNEYFVQVFVRTPGSRADRLVGASQIRF